MNVDILFIIPPFHTRNGGGSFFPLGLGYIIAEIESAGYTWKVINLTEIVHTLHKEDLERIVNTLKTELQQYTPSLIGIGPCITTQIRALKKIATTCREVLPQIPVFAGGPLASIADQEWLFYEELEIDYLIKGDGELAVVEAIQTVKKGLSLADSRSVSRKGYSYVNQIDDIDSMPFPYREFGHSNHFSIRRTGESENQAAMIASRGCPYACKYCVSGNLKHNNFKYRKRSLENILDEMQMLCIEHGIEDIVFYDDCFFHNPQTVNTDVEEFCCKKIDRKIETTWQIEMRPDVFVALSDGSIELLKKSGCRQISLGIEKASSRGMAFLGKKDCWPSLQEKVKHIKELADIAVSATFILGGENETAQDVEQLIEKSKTLQLDFAHYNPLFLYPGTPLYNEVFSDNRKWARLIFEDSLDWGEIVYETSQLSREKLIELVDYAYSQFYKDTPYAKEQMITDRFNLKGEQK